MEHFLCCLFIYLFFNFKDLTALAVDGKLILGRVRYRHKKAEEDATFFMIKKMEPSSPFFLSNEPGPLYTEPSALVKKNLWLAAASSDVCY
jgi:hypothetical protein